MVDSNQKQMGLFYRRKDNGDEAALICAGRLFHARAAATGKARSPTVTGESAAFIHSFIFLC